MPRDFGQIFWIFWSNDEFLYSYTLALVKILKFGFRENLAKLLRSESGAAAILVALATPVLAGTMGLAAEASYW
jgi:hypothetical protein